MKISKEQALKLIKASGGKTFGVTFTKKNGEERKMNARLGVKKGVTGVGMKYNPAEHNLITAFDMHKENFRMINLATMSRLSTKKKTYEIV
jgi:hypothetical protein